MSDGGRGQEQGLEEAQGLEEGLASPRPGALASGEGVQEAVQEEESPHCGSPRGHPPPLETGDAHGSPALPYR